MISNLFGPSVSVLAVTDPNYGTKAKRKAKRKAKLKAKAERKAEREAEAKAKADREAERKAEREAEAKAKAEREAEAAKADEEKYYKTLFPRQTLSSAASRLQNILQKRDDPSDVRCLCCSTTAEDAPMFYLPHLECSDCMICYGCVKQPKTTITPCKNCGIFGVYTDSDYLAVPGLAKLVDDYVEYETAIMDHSYYPAIMCGACHEHYLKNYGCSITSYEEALQVWQDHFSSLPENGSSLEPGVYLVHGPWQNLSDPFCPYGE